VTGPGGRLRGVEAVIDKDRSAALLAEGVAADGLLLLTDAPGIVEGWGTPVARVLRHTTPQALRGLAFEPGSMGPKVEAACEFVERTGRWAAIGPLEEAVALAAGVTGTLVQPTLGRLPLRAAAR
jgi:carbamate kinase